MAPRGEVCLARDSSIPECRSSTIRALARHRPDRACTPRRSWASRREPDFGHGQSLEHRQVRWPSAPADEEAGLDAAAAFVATVPPGRWTTYGDVAVAAGRSRSAAQGVASWIGTKGHLLANVHRVLNTDGEIRPAWTPAGDGLPANAREVEDLLL